MKLTPFTYPRLSIPRACLLAVALLGIAPLAVAERADRTKPMNIEADAMRYDDLKQTSVFSGDVVVTKGTITIRGARIDIRQDPEGYQYGVVTAAPGKRAFYRQKRETGNDEWIEGEAEVIEYDSRADNVKFIRNADMRRLIGTKLSDESSGPLIVYDQSNDTFTVNGSSLPPNAGVATQPGGRVRAILTPKAAITPEAKPAAPPANAPAPALRPSTTLRGEQRK
ncbi:MAG: lipopolysaccharide transport periplasmic protein LptA [Gammaproteobacteria bacterium]|nr:lipopolysaccharide transport periplasmic protein LptA [Gammaproteobacteria bacterium]MBU1441940.1 lipopolysaccharide transport periplasmic protein LptA [Gammaproteobacteria bacterium]MBU2289353.1 lipopolysaccharide transport periplasmic protein LptA [Gammaproteobacteria bacterium]